MQLDVQLKEDKMGRLCNAQGAEDNLECWWENRKKETNEKA
jgi:hypothetical protein